MGGASGIFISSIVIARDSMIDKPEWSKALHASRRQWHHRGADERKAPATTMVFDRGAARRYSPASTYKIPHTLFALDAGAVADEFQVFKWDGVKRTFASHNQDQTFCARRCAIRRSGCTGLRPADWGAEGACLSARH